MVAAVLGTTVATTALSSGLGASGQSAAAGQASGVQQDIYNQGADFEKGVYSDAANNLNNYIGTGNSTLGALTSFLGGAGTATFNPTQAQLEATPGYQFDLSQGEKAVTNSNAAKGLGTSGNALKEAASYATGLAQNTYGQQYAMYQDNLSQIYNRLMGVTQLGAQSAQALGNIGAGVGSSIMSGGVQTGSNIGSNIIGGANAQAAALTGTANSVASAGNSYMNNQNTQQLIQGLYG